MSLADYQLQESPNWGANGMGNTDAYEAITECIRVIEQAPTIDPVKRGKWELVDEAEPRRYGCSECKRMSYTQDNYCSYCGARME